MYAELMRTKKCSACKEEKLLNCFYKRQASKDGLGIYCKECDNSKSNGYRLLKRKEISLQRKRFREANRETVRFQKIVSKFKISKEQYLSLLNAQNNKCAICGKGPETERYKKLCLDHDHITGEVRGFLCNNCNRCIGLLNDNILILQKAVMYLSKYKK